MKNRVDRSGELMNPSLTEKLAKLEQYLPNQEQIVYEFGHFLSKRLHDSLTRDGFILRAQITLSDLQQGIGSSSEPMKDRIYSYPPIMYMTLSFIIQDIADAIFEEKSATSQTDTTVSDPVNEYGSDYQAKIISLLEEIFGK